MNKEDSKPKKENCDSITDTPVLIYDDRCYLCTKFASIASILSMKNITLVGHYSDEGAKIKSKIFDADYDSTQMFWFVDWSCAYGGRVGLKKLIFHIISTSLRHKKRKTARSLDSCDAKTHQMSSTLAQQCANTDENELSCKTPKAVFIRSASLLTHSKTVQIRQK